MSTINDTDLILVNRGGTSYRITMGDFDSVQDTDLILVNRGGTSYKLTKGQTSTILDTDLLFLNRGGTSYKVVGADFNNKVAITDLITAENTTTSVLTFASNKYLGNFLGNQAVKQDAPVTPVTSAITNVTTIDGEWQNGTISDRVWSTNEYASGYFVAIAASGSNPGAAYSTNGINYTGVNISTESSDWSDIAYGNGWWVSVARSGSGAKAIYTSNPTQPWSNTYEVPSGTTGWQGIAYGNGKFAAVAGVNQTGQSNKKIMVCTDPSANDCWSMASSSNDNIGWYSIFYANTMFMSGGTNGAMQYSSDGTSWNSAGSISTSSSIYGITYGNGVWVAVGFNVVAYSTNGNSWTTVTHPSSSDTAWQSVWYDDGKFVAVASQGTKPIIYSTDGINWQASGTFTGSQPSFYGVTYGAGVWSAIASSSGPAPYVKYSSTGSGEDMIGLTFTDNTQINNFLVGDAVTETSGDGTGTVSDVGATSMSLSSYGGTWSNGSTATGVLIDGAGIVASTDTANNTMTLQSPIERFAIGSKVSPA